MIHPETGEVLETRQEFQTALREVEEELAPLYRLRREIREVADVKFSPPDLPSPRWRTPTQDRVARCPRCGSPDHPFIYTKVFGSHEEMVRFLKLIAESEEAPNA